MQMDTRLLPGNNACQRSLPARDFINREGDARFYGVKWRTLLKFDVESVPNQTRALFGSTSPGGSRPFGSRRKWRAAFNGVNHNPAN